MARFKVVLFVLALLALVVVVAALAFHSSWQEGLSVMTAVTVVRRRTFISSNRKFKAFTVTGANTNTLDTRLKTVEGVFFDPITNTPTVVAESTVGGYITLTFTSGGTYTNQKLIVVGT